MENIRARARPLSDKWHNGTLELQHKILERKRSFGMIPVLPAFAGHVPRATERYSSLMNFQYLFHLFNLFRVYPNANYTRLTRWVGFEDQ